MTAPTSPTSPTSPIPPHVAAGGPPRPARSPWSAGRVVAVVLGALGALTGLALFAAGGALLAVAAAGEDGYLTDGDARLSSTGQAVVVREIGVSADLPDVVERDLLGEVRVRVTSDDAGTPLFVGIAPRADVDRFLAGVAHDEVRDFELDPFEVRYQPHAGDRPAQPPGDQPFWTVSDAGTGSSEVLWDVAPGEWAVVVMNADASAGVDATVGVGASVPVLNVVGIGLIVVGGAGVATGLVVVGLAAATRRRSPYTAVPAEPAR
jgi:hypothetical protein